MADPLAGFLKDVAKIEKQDAELTAAEQLNRLTKPGSSYLNLNPFEVLRCDPTTEPAKLKKWYRKLSFLVHPDKNRDDQDRAELAFDAVKKAYEATQDEDKMRLVNEIIAEAEHQCADEVSSLRRKAKRANQKTIPEDDPDVYAEKLRKITILNFAEYEKRRRDLEKAPTESKKKVEKDIEEIRAKKKRKVEREEKWEATRDVRMNTWQDFEKGKNKKEKKDKKEKKKKSFSFGYKPPKLKQEQRPEL